MLDRVNQANGLDNSLDHEEKMALDKIKSDVQVAKQEKRKHQPKSSKQQSTNENTCKWRISKPMGGRMLDVDPILTEDEKYEAQSATKLVFKKGTNVYSDI
jgi:NET1-associated nuclear protein 1 (U3 small nucleolar RNA-associated protein 17)